MKTIYFGKPVHKNLTAIDVKCGVVHLEDGRRGMYPKHRDKYGTHGDVVFIGEHVALKKMK